MESFSKTSWRWYVCGVVRHIKIPKAPRLIQLIQIVKAIGLTKKQLISLGIGFGWRTTIKFPTKFHWVGNSIADIQFALWLVCDLFKRNFFTLRFSFSFEYNAFAVIKSTWIKNKMCRQRYSENGFRAETKYYESVSTNRFFNCTKQANASRFSSTNRGLINSSKWHLKTSFVFTPMVVYRLRQLQQLIELRLKRFSQPVTLSTPICFLRAHKETIKSSEVHWKQQPAAR